MMRTAIFGNIANTRVRRVDQELSIERQKEVAQRSVTEIPIKGKWTRSLNVGLKSRLTHNDYRRITLKCPWVATSIPRPMKYDDGQFTVISFGNLRRDVIFYFPRNVLHGECEHDTDKKDNDEPISGRVLKGCERSMLPGIFSWFFEYEMNFIPLIEPQQNSVLAKTQEQRTILHYFKGPISVGEVWNTVDPAQNDVFEEVQEPRTTDQELGSSDRALLAEWIEVRTAWKNLLLYDDFEGVQVPRTTDQELGSSDMALPAECTVVGTKCGKQSLNDVSEGVQEPRTTGQELGTSDTALPAECTEGGTPWRKLSLNDVSEGVQEPRTTVQELGSSDRALPAECIEVGTPCGKQSLNDVSEGVQEPRTDQELGSSDRALLAECTEVGTPWGKLSLNDVSEGVQEPITTGQELGSSDRALPAECTEVGTPCGKQSLNDVFEGVQEPRTTDGESGNPDMALFEKCAQVWKPTKDEMIQDNWWICVGTDHESGNDSKLLCGNGTEHSDTESGFHEFDDNCVGSPNRTKRRGRNSLDSPLLPEDSCSTCGISFEEAMYYSRRRYGLDNCDHAFCFQCLQAVCKPTDHESVSCPKCGVQSEEISQSSIWKEGTVRFLLFKDLDLCQSSERFLFGVTNSVKTIEPVHDYGVSDI